MNVLIFLLTVFAIWQILVHFGVFEFSKGQSVVVEDIKTERSLNKKRRTEKKRLNFYFSITETNRIRRELRDKNTTVFNNLKVSFVASAFITFGYFAFLMATDSFSRNFFLHETVGKFLLLVILIVVFGVLAFITTIKSRAI